MSFNIKPLTTNREIKDFFYARDDELAFLVNQITKSEGGKAFAISGRRGSGKSTLINKLIDSISEKKEEYLLVKVDVPKKFDELLLLKRILRKVCESAGEVIDKENPLFKDILRRMIRLDFQTKYARQMGETETLKTAIKARLSALFVGVDTEAAITSVTSTDIIDEIQSREYDVESVQYDLEKLLKELINVFEGIVVIVDETDKSDYEGAIRTLDNIKPLFWIDKCYYVFVGSEEFYEDYTRGIKTGKKTLLDSLFTRIIYLQPFDNDEIKELLTKRIDEDIGKETDKILGIISTLSKGSPRDAVRYCDLLIGECGSIGNATLGDLGKVIRDTYPNFPRDNIKYFIPFSIYISEISPGHIDPIVESCAINIISTIMEMDPNPEEKDAIMTFSCLIKILEDAIIGRVEEGKFNKTQFDIAIAFLRELGLIIEVDKDKIILEDNIPSEYRKMFTQVV